MRGASFPTEAFCKYVLNVDISQAYGSQLMNSIYPIGKPRVYSKTYNHSGITLRDFLNNFEHYLKLYKILYLYKIVVKGSFEGF